MSIYGVALVSVALFVSLAGRNLASYAWHPLFRSSIEKSDDLAMADNDESCRLIIKMSDGEQARAKTSGHAEQRLKISVINQCRYDIALLEFQVETLEATGTVKFENLGASSSLEQRLLVKSLKGLAIRSVVVVDAEARRRQPQVIQELKI